MSPHAPWLNMPEEFYQSLSSVAEQDSVRPEDVLARVLRILESAYRVRGGQPFALAKELEEPVGPLVPVWFKVPEEFWVHLGRLVAKTGKGQEELLAEGLDLLIRRSGFAVIQSHRNP